MGVNHTVDIIPRAATPNLIPSSKYTISFREKCMSPDKRLSLADLIFHGKINPLAADIQREPQNMRVTVSMQSTLNNNR
jgi:hypothetical protein